MPFQSEKQRRFLHANHPEIAKRWERDYANGGISNHFRRKFFTGALADTQGPAGGQAMSPGTSTTGGSRNLGGGQGGQGNQGGGDGPIHPIHQGPTAAELAAREEARLQALEDARSKQMYENTMAKRKKNIKYYNENLKSKFDTPTWDTDEQSFQARNLLYNPEASVEYYYNKMDESDSDDPLNFLEKKHLKELQFQQMIDFKKQIDIENLNEELGVGEEKDDTPSIGQERHGPEKGWRYKGGKLAGLTKKQKQALKGSQKNLKNIMGISNEEILENIKMWDDPDDPATIKDIETFYSAKGGVARKNYFHGGILDINESEEIISDDGNDIELTDYNAAFDDPNDLSTGVKSLFQAKDGGRIGFANGPPGGGATSLGSGRDYSGSDRGPTPSDGGMGAKEQYIQTQYTSPEAIAAKTRRELREIVETGMGSPIEKYDTPQQHLADTPGDLDFKSPQHNPYKSGINVDYKRTAYEQTLANQKAKLKSMGLGKVGGLGVMLVTMLAIGVPLGDALKYLPKTISIGKGDLSALLKVSLPVMKAKKELIASLENHKGGLLGQVDILNPNEMKSKIGTNISDITNEITDLTKTQEDDTKGDGGIELPPQLGGPSTEEMATEYPTDWLGAIRERQAQKKAYDEKIERERLAREENPIIGGTERNIIAIGNSGGLANLFRVKNQ